MFPVIVKAKIDDRSYPDKPTVSQLSNWKDTYWGKAVIECKIGDVITLEVPDNKDNPPQMIHNGIGYFSAEGNFSITQDGQWKDYVNKEANSHFLESELTQHALIGRFGLHGTPFNVKKAKTPYPADGDGLYLTVNDTIRAYYNNNGQFIVNVGIESQQTTTGEHNIKVPGDLIWGASIENIKNAKIIFTGSGLVTVGGAQRCRPDGANIVGQPPNSIPPAKIASANFLAHIGIIHEHALIGKLGVNGDPFEIGFGPVEMDFREGPHTLYFSVNDKTDSFPGNKDNFTVKVDIKPIS